MAHISAVVTLRPIRFAFLVKPNDSKRLLEIFQINTCLWGGKFNPIIPFLAMCLNGGIGMTTNLRALCRSSMAILMLSNLISL